MKMVIGMNGFGLGVWRNRVEIKDHKTCIFWTIAVGPFTIFVGSLNAYKEGE